MESVLEWVPIMCFLSELEDGLNRWVPLFVLHYYMIA